MLLVVLALLWAVVLLPGFLRRRSEIRPAESISAFRQQLTVLRRARPPAARDLVPERPRAHAYMTAGAAPVTLLAARRSMAAGRSTSARPVGPRALAAAGLPSARARTLQRRRYVFAALVSAAGATVVLGLIPALHVLLYVHIGVDVLLAAYVVLLVRQRGVRAEQEMKVRFFPGPQAIEPAMLRRSTSVEPALLRRSAN